MRKGVTDAFTAAQLRELLHYDKETGIFRWLIDVRPGQVEAGDVAGFINGGGYRQISIDGGQYRASRLAWLYMTGKWPTNQIDHKDRCQDNNRWENLREATKSQNGANRRVSRINLLGIKGVSFNKRAKTKPYEARVWVNRQCTFLGGYTTPEEASAVYVAAAMVHHGEFAMTAVYAGVDTDQRAGGT